MQIVNGYVCQTGCDVSAARAGHDPKNPHDDPIKARQLAEQKALSSGRPIDQASASTDAGFAVDAVAFGGRLAGLSAARASSADPVQLVDRTA